MSSILATAYRYNDYNYDYNYSYSHSVNTVLVLMIIAAVLAIATTVLAFIFIVPEKRRARLNKFGKFLHDTCNFKYLLIEKIFQALYIFATAFTIFYGLFLLFCGNLLGFLLYMILGPIVIRVIYELLMMTILLLKNVIMINKKLKNQNSTNDNLTNVFAAPDFMKVQQPVTDYKEMPQAPVQQQAARFCHKCGTPLDESGSCPNCSK